jgi:cell division protein FtsL
MAAATAQERHAARTRSQRAPALPQRRVSGGRPGTDSRPHAVTTPPPATGLLERLKGLPDHRVVDRLLRGRAWICLIGVALMGIVAMQVSLLKLNSGISRAVETSSTLERQNSDMEADIARLAAGERIRAAAERRGMVTPAAGDVHYVRVRSRSDAARAARRMRPPSDAARELMANHGVVPGSLMAPAGTTAGPAPATTTAPSVTAAPTSTTATTAAPAVAAAPATTTTTTAAATATPAPVAAAAPPVAPTSGGTAAAAATQPQG